MVLGISTQTKVCITRKEKFVIVLQKQCRKEGKELCAFEVWRVLNDSMNKVYVTQSSMPPYDEYIEEIKEFWTTHRLTNMGVKHKELEIKLIEYLEVPHVELMTNGHMALELAIQALNMKGEVITTPFTFASTTHAIVRNGLTPVFCDIDPETYTIDVNKIENLITDKTCAIVPVHVYGNICDVEGIDALAKKYNLKVIYDAAHSFGEKYKGQGVAQFGDASIFSFHATKVFNTIEGGAVCFTSEALKGILMELKNFGIHGAESVMGVGTNAKMNEFCAAMGICNLRHLKEEIAKRRIVDERYREILYDIPGVKLSTQDPNVEYNYAYFPVVFEDAFGVSRDVVFEKLAENNIMARKYFYPLVNEFECYSTIFDSDSTPVAKNIGDRVLTLPMYADLSLGQVNTICDIIRSCCNK